MKFRFPTKIEMADACGSASYVPKGLLLQWHITERCNLRCSHCYQDVYGGDELSSGQQLEVLEQFKSLLSLWRNEHQKPVKGHITITGGEPFVRKDFIPLLETFVENRKLFSFAILCNGSYIDRPMAEYLSTLKPRFIQVSIEGTRETHDAIRGEGDFDKTVGAIRHLVRAGIDTLISFTAHRGNYKEFPEVAALGRKLKVTKVWSDRLIPNGSGENLHEQMLSPEETREFFLIMDQSRRKSRWLGWNRTEIAMDRALQFFSGHGKPYHCTAGDSLITVQPNGDVYPCRRLPIHAGNLMETPLLDLYYQSPLFQSLRDKNRVSEGCKGCFYDKLCGGGLKCLSYAVTGDPFQKDPGCSHEESAESSSPKILETSSI